MFFEKSEQFKLNKYIQNEWVSVAIFYEDVIDSSSSYSFDGYGVVSKAYNSQYYDNISGHLIKLNGKYYFFSGYKIEDSSLEGLKFRSILEVNQEFIDSLSKNAEDYYKDLESSLNVEFKFYSYPEEERIAITKAGEGGVDMYASYSVKNRDSLSGKVYPNTFTAAKNQVLNNLLNERLANIKGTSK